MGEISKKFMKEKIEKLQGIESYKLAESTEKLASRLGIPLNKIIKLNFNENLFLPKKPLTDI